jgi:hypothetical protein
MPLEIKELNIKINVDENPTTSEQNVFSSNDKENIIAECVEQVLEILSKTQER